MLNVCALIVTSGRRHHLLEEVLLSVLSLNISRIVIFDNASEEKIQLLFERNELIGRCREKIELISSDINIGSAGGFGAGLESLHKQNDCHYIWLLDDDNKPHENALNALLMAHESIKKQYTDTDFCLLSHRRDRKLQVSMLQGGKTEKVYPRPSEFIGVHVRDLTKKVIRYISRKVFSKNVKNDHAYSKDIAELPFAPFGGLFIKRSLLDKVGYPRKDFFLYADDQEFTYRMNQNGIKIFLVAGSVIEDIDASWQAKVRGGTQFSRFFKSNEEGRLYYFIRNHAYLDCHLFKRSRCLYFMNKCLFLVTCWITSKIYRNSEKFRLIRTAINDGENGKLGVNELFSL